MSDDNNEFVKGYVLGIRNSKDKIEELFDLIKSKQGLYNEVIVSLARGIYNCYYRNNDRGAFWMVADILRDLDTKRGQFESHKETTKAVLVGLSGFLCEDLNKCTPEGHFAEESMRTTYSAAIEIYDADPDVAIQLMAKAGEKLLGPTIDQLFWDWSVVAENNPSLEWAVRAMADGMKIREDPIKMTKNHLLAEGRGPKDKKRGGGGEIKEI